MQDFFAILQSPEVVQKLETSSILQLDNPIVSKKGAQTNVTKSLHRKRVSNSVHCAPEFLIQLQKSAAEYHKVASQKYALYEGCMRDYLFCRL